MKGHEDTRRPFAPTPAEQPGSPLSERETKILNAALDRTTERMADYIGKRLGELQGEVDALAGAVGGLVVAAETVAPETRLDSLERRIEAFGLGGETVGDALQLAAFALANARAVADAVSRITGSTVPLPPAPEFKGRLEEPRVKGAELAEIM